MPKTDEEFQTLLDDGVKHRLDLATLDARKRLIDKEIIEHLFESESRYMTEDGGFKVQEDRGSWALGAKVTKTLDPAKLLAAGVAIETIEAATTTSVSEPFVTFYPKREPKPKKEKTA